MILKICEYQFRFRICMSMTHNQIYYSEVTSDVMQRNIIIFFHIFLSSLRRYSDRYKERFLNGRCSKWSIANDIRDIVHGVRTDLWLFGRSVFATLDHDLGRGPVEWHNAGRLIHANIWIVYRISSVGRCRRSIVQHHCADHHIGSIYQRCAFENAGHVLLCHTSWFGSRVSGALNSPRILRKSS